MITCPDCHERDARIAELERDNAELSRAVSDLAREAGHARLQLARDLPMMAATIAAGVEAGPSPFAQENGAEAIAAYAITLARAIIAELGKPEAG